MSSIHCCQTPTRPGRLPGLCRDVASTTTLGLALLLPKCPLCVLAWAAALGIGATWQRYILDALDPGIRPMIIVLLALPLLLRLACMLFRHAKRLC